MLFPFIDDFIKSIFRRGEQLCQNLQAPPFQFLNLLTQDVLDLGDCFLTYLWRERAVILEFIFLNREKRNIAYVYPPRSLNRVRFSPTLFFVRH